MYRQYIERAKGNIELSENISVNHMYFCACMSGAPSPVRKVFNIQVNRMAFI